MRVVICGGGVIGACLAYFLGLRGVEAVVVERTGVACAASGKAGGFLALDWCDGTPLGPLARRSFALHADLAARFVGGWGYRRLEAFSATASARRGPAAVAQRLGTVASTAQVHPARFATGMMAAAVDLGAELRIAAVSGVMLSADGSAATGVTVVGGETIAGDAVVIAMGPWSILARRWLPVPAVHGLKGNSVVLASGDATPPHALFVELEDGAGAVHAPELFPRPDGTTYFCGLPGEAPLPDDPAGVAPDPGAVDGLRAMARLIAPALGDAPVVARQACFRPMTADGLPLLGAVPGMANAFVATGHGVWGILNAPASGEALAGLIAGGGTAGLDLSPFDPGRFGPAGGGAARQRPPSLSAPPPRRRRA